MDRDEPIRVLIADDHAVVRQGVAAIIATDPRMTIVAEAKNGREAVELFRRERPHVGLIDLKMPELDGVGTITESLTTVFGWNEWVFRAWYITGALCGGAPLAPGR